MCYYYLGILYASSKSQQESKEGGYGIYSEKLERPSTDKRSDQGDDS